MDLLSEPIEVELRDEPGVLVRPCAFTWRGRRYGIVRLLEVWTDAGFADPGGRRKHWWERRHRNYYRVETEEGDVWDLYLDRSGRRRRWFLSRRRGRDEAG